MRALSQRMLYGASLAGCLALALVPARAAAQELSASAAVGVGAFDASAAGSIDVGVEVASNRYAMGLGARLRWVASEGFRSEEWDERSEWARILRYLVYLHDQEALRTSVAMGELGWVTLGHGAVISSYMSGLDLDHRHLGMHARVETLWLGGEAMVDDVVAPRLLGARGYWYRRTERVRLEAGGSVAADVAAPRAGVDMTEAVPIATVDASAGIHNAAGTMAVQAYAELATISDVAVGAHAGVAAWLRLLTGTALSLRAELSLGSESYIPGWIGPLYEIERRMARAGDAAPLTKLDVARQGGLGGAGFRVEVHGQQRGIGGLRAGYTQRPGLPGVVTAQVLVPYLERVQAGAWLSAETGQDAAIWAMAGEVRARLTSRIFATLEVGRMYREATPGALEAAWLADGTVGLVFDL